jgi:hypothetical protein
LHFQDLGRLVREHGAVLFVGARAQGLLIMSVVEFIALHGQSRSCNQRWDVPCLGLALVTAKTEFHLMPCVVAVNISWNKSKLGRSKDVDGFIGKSRNLARFAIFSFLSIVAFSPEDTPPSRSPLGCSLFRLLPLAPFTTPLGRALSTLDGQMGHCLGLRIELSWRQLLILPHCNSAFSSP